MLVSVWSTIKDFTSTNSNLTWLNPHRKIEQFGIKLAATVALLGVGTTISIVHNNHRIYEQLMTINNAGATSTFSKSSDVTLKLGTTRMSPNGKMAFVPVTFSSTSSMSRDPNNYKIFVWTSNNKPLKYHVRGQFVFYGTTGRAVLVLTSPEKIANQPLFVYFRNDKHIPTAEEADADSSMTNAGANNNYGKYDVAMFKINPGARSVQKEHRVDANVNDDAGVEAIYGEIFGNSDERNIHKVINHDRTKIEQNQMVADQEYSALKSEGFDVPAKPKWTKDSWRPFDMVDIKTNKTKNGHNAQTYSYTASEDPDQANFPGTLNGKNGITTQTQNTNKANNDSSGDQNVGGTQEDPSIQWNNLTKAWTNILNLKRDIYITQYTQLARIYQQKKSIFEQTEVGTTHHVVIKSPVKVEKK